MAFPIPDLKSVCGEGSPFERKEILLHTLEELKISILTKSYDPALNMDFDSDGTYCKNLLLKDRKGQYYLLIIPMSKQIDLKKLKFVLNAHRNLSFAQTADVQRLLYAEPGAISPFGVMFSKQPQQIRIIVEYSLSICSRLYFHPFVGKEAISISFTDLDKFIELFYHYIEVYSLFGQETDMSLTLMSSQHELSLCAGSKRSKKATCNFESGKSFYKSLYDECMDSLEFETMNLDMRQITSSCCLL